MKIILVGGGSGGHIYPCLEMAKFLKHMGHEVLLAGAKDSNEEKIYLDNGFNFVGLAINKKKIRSYFTNRNAIRKTYNEFMPDAIFLFGNYISVSFGLEAILCRIPIYLHEQNVIYGRANMLLGLFAKRIYLSLPIKRNIYKRKSILLGNPKSDNNVEPKKFNDKYNVLIVMGSLGSASMNNIFQKLIEVANPNVALHLVTGKKHYSEFIKLIDVRENIHCYPYLDDLGSYIKSCDILVTRAGATTISEILVNQVASIIIPSPYVKNNHQYLNAKYLEEHSACILLEEKDLTAVKINNTINELIYDYSKRLNLKINAGKLAIYNSKKKIHGDLVKDYE